MSLARLPLASLSWSELVCILDFLSLRELWLFGSTNRSAFVTFLREKSLREGRRPRTSLTRLPRFLCKLSPHEKVLLVSYPRSGNSFMRYILEQEMGIITGSDSRPNRTLSASLLRFGYAGEGITDQSVWVVKSHYPERLGYVKFPVTKVILLVRNPFDAIQSYFHMGMTNTHDKNLSRDVFTNLQELWKEFMVNESKIWSEFHRFWLSKLGTTSALVLRYEDLLENQQGVIEEAISFMRSGQTPDALSRYIPKHEHAIPIPVGYKSRNKTVGKALNAMAVDDALAIATQTRQYMELFGYLLASTPVKDNGVVNHHSSAAHALTLEVLPLSGLLNSAAQKQAQGAILVNSEEAVRPVEDRFGRRITELRKSLTAGDTKPFPVS